MASPAITQLVEEPQRPITFEEYRALPGDGPRYELINGELYMSPAPKAIHQFVVGELFAALRDHVRPDRRGIVMLAPFDVRIADYTAVQPDLLFFTAENRDALGRDFASGIPDLIVEVLSASNRRMDLIVKRAIYAQRGIPEYWIVDPKTQSISVNILEGRHYSDTTHAQGTVTPRALPELSIEIAPLFDMSGWFFGASDNDEDDEGE